MAPIRAEKLGAESYIHKLASEVAVSYKRFVSPLQQSIDRLVQVDDRFGGDLGCVGGGACVVRLFVKERGSVAGEPTDDDVDKRSDGGSGARDRDRDDLFGRFDRHVDGSRSAP